MTYGQPYVGTDHGPGMLRELGLLQKLSALNWRVEDLPDLDFETMKTTTSSAGNDTFKGNAKNHKQVGAGAKMLARTVEEQNG